ncbi:MAG: hypothetical protein JWL61_345 [Gemmatimonadetes bacterium]|nr:hypothetical protein [Gemmatimonadota bacterium]
MTDPIDNKHNLDFGEDADVMLPDDPNFDAWIAQAAPSLNAPSSAPRLEMWDAIQAAQKTAAAAAAGEIAGVRPLRRSRFLLPVAIAAALLLGIAIDRISLRQAGDVQSPAPVAQIAPQPSTPTVDRRVGSTDARTLNAARTTPNTQRDVRTPDAPTADPSRLYRLAATQTLTQAEALLTAYRSSGVAERDPAAAKQLGDWGRQVLSSTRLLLDSPAGDDAVLRPLLNDLELVLVQIIRLSGAPLDANDRALIDDVLRSRDLLPRIRTAVPAGSVGTASDD